MQISHIVMFVLLILTFCVAIVFIVLYAQEKNKYDLLHVNKDISITVSPDSSIQHFPFEKPALCAKSFKCVGVKAPATATPATATPTQT
jgi:hypothetical protein